jgi:hypothetical protein
MHDASLDRTGRATGVQAADDTPDTP